LRFLVGSLGLAAHGAKRLGQNDLGGSASTELRDLSAERHDMRGDVLADFLRVAVVGSHRPAYQGAQHKRSTTMSIFGNIMSAIFKSASPAGTRPAAAPPSATPGATTPSAPAAQVDVAAVLTELSEQNEEKLDWRRSIVDLMKLLNLDSSLAARKQLAKELRYAGDMNDSASMNIWLHKQVMQKLAENGGKVPADLRAA